MEYPNEPVRWADVATLVNEASDMGLPLDPHSELVIDYFVYGGTTDECRFRYESIISALWSRFVGTHHITEGSREHDGTTQHYTKVHFGSGKAAYRVVWIERHAPQTLDIPLDGGMQP